MRKRKSTLIYSLILVIGLIFTNATIFAQSAQEALDQLDLEKYENATSTIRNAIDKDPGNAANYYYAGLIYLNIEKADSAKLFFDKGISINGKEALNYVGQGYLALNAGKPQIAQQLFDQALSLSKEKDGNVYNKIADALIDADTKDPNRALSYLDKAASLKKDKNKNKAMAIEVENNLLRGDAYLAIGDGGKAISAYEKALSINPQLPVARTKIGRIYMIPKNYEAAEAEFQKAVELDPNYAPVYRDLGELNFAKRDINKAKEMYIKYRELSNVQGPRLGIIYYLMRDYETAVSELQQALTSDPNNLVLHRLLGYSLNRLGDSLAAKESLDKYFSLVKPEKTLASDFMHYGDVMLKLGNDSSAVKNYLIAIDKDTANLEMVEEKADELRKARKNGAAAALYDYLLAKKANPTTNDYYKAGNAYLGDKQYAKADSCYQKVIAATSDNYLGYNALALSKLYQDPEGKRGLAKDPYEKVISILEADPAISTEKSKQKALTTAYQYMASYYTQKEDLKTAGSYWDKVEKVDPANTGPKAFRDYLVDVERYKKAQQKAQQQQKAKK